jgi:hypothetical protein
MSHPACIALLICSLTVVSTAGFLPFLNSGLGKEQRSGFPTWTLVLAGLALVFSLAKLGGRNPNQNQLFDAVALTAAMLGGICVKWMMETVAQRKFTIHEAVLFRTLLVAPLAVAIAPQVFGVRASPAALSLWFLNGFFWHTLFSVFDRLFTKERVIIRRREPPTLPYDFRKPEID